ncbi:MAG: hypothetical protein GY830_09520 [Bacteroidetes bacterium]|nr:hypothetical protein [Bacteroidota bacterium]
MGPCVSIYNIYFKIYIEAPLESFWIKKNKSRESIIEDAMIKKEYLQELRIHAYPDAIISVGIDILNFIRDITKKQKKI